MSVVVVNHDLPIASEVKNRRDDFPVISTSKPKETVSALGDAEILVCNPSCWDNSFFKALDSNSWVQATSTGYDTLPVDKLRSKDITFTNGSDIHDPVVAKHVFALALAFSRMIPTLVLNQTEGKWGSRTELSPDLSDWKRNT